MHREYTTDSINNLEVIMKEALFFHIKLTTRVSDKINKTFVCETDCFSL